MKRYRILHQTNYQFSAPVLLHPHTLRLRPREGHELRIEKSWLEITPPASIRWQRDVEGNSVAVATFNEASASLSIKSETIIQQHDEAPYNFLVEDYAVDYPFQYEQEDIALLTPYMKKEQLPDDHPVSMLLKSIWQPGNKIQSFGLLLALNKSIYEKINYQIRHEEGVQTAEQTLQLSSGSCRDSAFLFMQAARQLGFAARFVSGYIYSYSPIAQSGSTHAWAEVFLPGAGWKGFDQTIGNIVGTDHIAVAVARLPQAVPPVEGSFHGVPGSSMSVNVQVTEIL